MAWRPAMIAAIATLLLCQLLGEGLHLITGLPLPGAVIGMFLLLGWLLLRPGERPTLVQVSAWLTAHLSVMFVPAAVGIMEEGSVLARNGVAIVVATLISTALTMAVTALVFRWALARAERGA